MGPQPSWLRASLLLLACGRQPTDCMPVVERPTGWCVCGVTRLIFRVSTTLSVRFQLDCTSVGWPGTPSIANDDKQATTCAKCEKWRTRHRTVCSDDNLPMPSCTNVRGSPSRLRPGRTRASGAPTAHLGPRFSCLAQTRGPARSRAQKSATLRCDSCSHWRRRGSP